MSQQRITRDQRGWGIAPDIGTTAKEGKAAGDAANAALNAGLNEAFDRAQPGNGKPFNPDAADPSTDMPKPARTTGKI